MAGRQYHITTKDTTDGMVYLSSSFLTNGSSSPVVSMSAASAGNTLRGDGIASIVRTATGTFTVTLEQGSNFRYSVAKTADMDAPISADGAYATVGAMSNEGTGLPLSFILYTHAAAGTLTDFTARRVSIFLALKNSAVGK